MRVLNFDDLIKRNREILPDPEDEELIRAMKEDKDKADKRALQRERIRKVQTDKATKEEWLREREKNPGLKELLLGASKDWLTKSGVDAWIKDNPGQIGMPIDDRPLEAPSVSLSENSPEKENTDVGAD